MDRRWESPARVGHRKFRFALTVAEAGYLLKGRTEPGTDQSRAGVSPAPGVWTFSPVSRSETTCYPWFGGKDAAAPEGRLPAARWSLDISGLVAWAGAAAPARRGAPKAPTIPAQPSGLGTWTADGKAPKARSISLTIEAWVNGLLTGCGTSIPHSTISEIGPRRWRLRLLLGS